MHIKNWLKWRYATKKFDGAREVSEVDLNYILEAGNLAATSYGLQPFKIIVITDEAKKQALVPAAYNQAQVGGNSALVVLAASTNVDETFITEFTTRTEVERGLETGTLDGYKQIMVGQLAGLSAADRLVWSQKQAYIALGTMLVAAAEKEVDQCPMEGFDPAAFNEILGLTAQNLHATVIMPLGYRSPEDKTQHYKKVRRDLSEMVVRI